MQKTQLFSLELNKLHCQLPNTMFFQSRTRNEGACRATRSHCISVWTSLSSLQSVTCQSFRVNRWLFLRKPHPIFELLHLTGLCALNECHC